MACLLPPDTASALAADWQLLLGPLPALCQPLSLVLTGSTSFLRNLVQPQGLRSHTRSVPPSAAVQARPHAGACVSVVCSHARCKGHSSQDGPGTRSVRARSTGAES